MSSLSLELMVVELVELLVLAFGPLFGLNWLQVKDVTLVQILLGLVLQPLRTWVGDVEETEICGHRSSLCDFAASPPTFYLEVRDAFRSAHGI